MHLAVDAFENESQHSNVSSRAQGGEIVLDESCFFAYANLLEETSLQLVEWFQNNIERVVVSTWIDFQQAQYVRFILLD